METTLFPTNFLLIFQRGQCLFTLCFKMVRLYFERHFEENMFMTYARETKVQFRHMQHTQSDFLS